MHNVIETKVKILNREKNPREMDPKITKLTTD